ncbi:3-methyladenine DNA glycosylase [bacterium]|nr:3-methyladenine DNA glycosylase [bacterium]
MGTPFKLYYDRRLAELLADKLTTAGYQSFDRERFIVSIDRGVEPLELKARVDLIAETLAEILPGDYVEASAILHRTLGPKLEGEKGMFDTGYWLYPIGRFIERYGLGHFELSMTLIAELTQRFTGEFAVRPFIETSPEHALEWFERWTRHESVHVRRLASEGLRPRLPWAKRLRAFERNPASVFDILDMLKDDPSRFVQTSVGNNLNDHSKDHPAWTLAWIGERMDGITPARQWIFRHGLRTMRKAEDPRAVNLLEELKTGRGGAKQ